MVEAENWISQVVLCSPHVSMRQQSSHSLTALIFAQVQPWVETSETMSKTVLLLITMEMKV